MKSGIRLAAFASGPIGANKHAVSGRTILVAVIAKKSEIEGVLASSVSINGTDSTKEIMGMINRSRFKSQVKLIVLNGIALAGLNVADAEALALKGFGVMVVTRHRPRPSKLIYALRVFSKSIGADTKKREQIVKRFALHKPERLNGLYVQHTMEKREAAALLTYAAGALRLAHIIASGVAKGESKGRI